MSKMLFCLQKYLEKEKIIRDAWSILPCTQILDTLFFTLLHLTLVLNVRSDELIILIANSLPFLVELDLEDGTSIEPKLPHDFTNAGLQSLGLFQHLTSLSIVGSILNFPVSFKRVNGLGLMLLS